MRRFQLSAKPLGSFENFRVYRVRLCLELLGESVVDMTIQNCRCGTEMATLRDASNTNRRFNQESELFQLTSLRDRRH